MSDNGKRILVALDYPNLLAAHAMSRLLRRTGSKVGMELCTAEGVPAVVRVVGKNILLDLKFHDIPNTVAGAVHAAAKHGVKMLNVHCLGGLEMMKAASKASFETLNRTKTYRPLIIGVTILTSHDRASLGKVGIDPNLPMEEIVVKLATLATQAGLDGVVCSPKEISVVRKVVRDERFLIITPGIRRKNDASDDQKRTLTLTEAADLGANYFVIGRPITQAHDPVEAADAFIEELDQALGAKV